MQRNTKELAILGGTQSFSEPMHVGKPNLGNRQALLARIENILDRRVFTNNGPLVREFEQRIADYVGVEHCIAMCNGTVALEIAARALGMREQVILPSMTFVASAHSLQWQQIAPVFCDIDATTHHINPDKIDTLITPLTTGILAVNLWGRPCDLDAIEAIAKKHKLKLLVDSAHAFGCSYRGKKIGNFGDAEVFSFHATKVLSAMEGGAVVTNDDNLAQEIRLMSNFGFAGRDQVVYLGINGKMDEMSAAMGLTSLENIDYFIESNLKNYLEYKQHLRAIPGVKLLDYDRNQRNNYQYIVLEIEETDFGLSRDELQAVLHAENIDVRRYFYPGCHRMEPYRSLYPHSSLWLSNTESVLNRVLALPTGTSVSPVDVYKVCQVFELAHCYAGKIRQTLSGVNFISNSKRSIANGELI